MDYEGLINAIKAECENRGISLYRLSGLADVPISTIYGIFNRKNKAQIDTLYAILVALGLELSITAAGDGENGREKRPNDWLEDVNEMSYEKRYLIKLLVHYLKD